MCFLVKFRTVSDLNIMPSRARQTAFRPHRYRHSLQHLRCCDKLKDIKKFKNSAVAITLQFVKYVDEAGADLSGEFTLTVGDASATYVVENFDNTVFNKGVNNNVWTNGGAEKLYNISLATAGCVTIASSPVVPEPATATLSLLALCGLAARRRRK